MMTPIQKIRSFIRSFGPVEQAQVVASTSVVVSMATVVSAIVATGQPTRLMDFIAILTIGVFGFTSVLFSLQYSRQLDAQRRNLLALNAIGDAVNHSVKVPAVIESSLSAVISILGCSQGWIYMSDGEAIVLSSRRGCDVDFLEAQGIHLDTFCAWAQQPRVVHENLNDHAGTVSPTLKALGVQFWASIPLSIQGGSIGALIVAGPQPNPQTPVESELMQAFGNQISIALANARMFEALRISRAQYADLFERAPDMYLNVRPDRSILGCNETGANMLEMTKEDLVDCACESLFEEPHRADIGARIDRSLRDREPIRNLEASIASRSGQQYQVLLNSTIETDPKGNVIGTRIAVRDITARKKMEQAILHAQKIDSIGNLAGGIAHDFNNLLTAILGSATIMRRRVTTDPKLVRYADIIESSARRGSALTRQLLTFARKTERQVTTVDIHALIKDTLDLYERTVPKNITTETHLTAEPVIVSGDEGQLQQALLNLFLNARDAMPDGGVLRIITSTMIADSHMTTEFSTIRPGPFVLITISDTGKGIPKEIQRRIFEPFFTTKDHGTGLGLSVVYGVVQSHGGFLNLESALGSGTTFSIYLPRSAGASSHETTKRQRLPRGKETILIVDDEVSVSEIAQDMLTNLGYTVYTEHDGKSGIDLYRMRQSSIDLILLDVNMPVMGGKEAFAKLREIDPACRIIIVTGYGREMVEASSFSGTINAFLQKPFQHETLALAVRRVLDSDATGTGTSTGATSAISADIPNPLA